MRELPPVNDLIKQNKHSGWPGGYSDSFLLYRPTRLVKSLFRETAWDRTEPLKTNPVRSITSDIAHKDVFRIFVLPTLC